jgi:hypothetical protein
MWHALRLCLIAAAMLWAGAALAQPTGAKQSEVDRARRMGEQGVALFEKGQHAEALVLFERAEALHHAPTLVLYIARSYDKMGRLLEALKYYRELLAEELDPDGPGQFEDARAAAHGEVDLLIPRIPTVTITTEGAPETSITVKVNGKVVPRLKWQRLEIDPGEHTFEATAEGYQTATRNVVVPEGARNEVSLTLGALFIDTPSAPEDDSLPLGPAWIAMGTGAAALIVGAITGGLHLAKVDDLKARCSADSHCPAADAEEASSAQTLATISTATFIIGGVLAAAGATYAIVVITTEDDSAAAEVSTDGLRFRFRF